MQNPSPIGPLTPESSTQDLLAWLFESYAARGPDFHQARLALEAWADELSHSKEQRDTFPLLSPSHLSSQERILEDLKRKHTDTGTPVRRARLLDPLFRALEQAQSLVRMETKVRELTWKDDGMNLIHSDVSVRAQVDLPAPSKPRPF